VIREGLKALIGGGGVASWPANRRPRWAALLLGIGSTASTAGSCASQSLLCSSVILQKVSNFIIFFQFPSV
jgi:hypothetical protein